MKTTNLPDPVKRLIHVGSRGYGRLTAEHRMLPSFLICGGQRCGTTSMYRALAQHPAILKAVLHKGVHYFDVGYRRGMSWYRGHFPLLRTAQRICDDLGVIPQTFESSPYYMYHPHAVARIAADLPEVKLVVLVRDPVERAYSQHAHEVARGFESEVSFARALTAEPGRLAGVAAKFARIRATTASPTSTTRTPSGASTSRTWSGWPATSAGTGSTSSTASGSSRRRRRSSTGCWTSSVCRTSGTRSSTGTTPGRAPRWTRRCGPG